MIKRLFSPSSGLLDISGFDGRNITTSIYAEQIEEIKGVPVVRITGKVIFDEGDVSNVLRCGDAVEAIVIDHDLFHRRR